MGEVSREKSPLGHAGGSGLEGKVLLSMGYPGTHHAALSRTEEDEIQLGHPEVKIPPGALYSAVTLKGKTFW